MSCSTGCPTPGVHKSWGECLRSKNLRNGIGDATAQKKADKGLDQYANARKNGIQPKSTHIGDVNAAVRESDRTGQAFQA